MVSGKLDTADTADTAGGIVEVDRTVARTEESCEFV